MQVHHIIHYYYDNQAQIQRAWEARPTPAFLEETLSWRYVSDTEGVHGRVSL